MKNRSERRGPSPLTVGPGATAKPAAGVLVLDTPQAAGAGCERPCITCDHLEDGPWCRAANIDAAWAWREICQGSLWR